MAARTKETYIIALTNEEKPYVVTYYMGSYRIYRQDDDHNYWSLEAGNKVFESGVKKGADGYLGCRLTMEEAGLILSDPKLVWEFQHDAIEKSGSKILQVVQAMVEGYYEPKAPRTKRDKKVQNSNIEIQEVLVLRYKDAQKTIVLQQASNHPSKFTLSIDYINISSSKLDLDVTDVPPIVEMLMRIM